MKLRLLHLFDDVMNLYGEYANVAVLARYLTDLGNEVSVDTLSLYEKKDISNYDFYYMGAGTERRQKLALSQLKEYRDVLLAACDAGKVLLFTGNSFELLGARVTAADGTAYAGLHFAAFETVESTRRNTGDALARFGSDVLVGFVNKCSVTTGVETPLFQLEMGFGNEKKQGAEGFRRCNCFGTHLTGPILVKNPAMLRYIARILLGNTFSDTVAYPAMEQSYDTTKQELYRRLESQKK